MSNNTNPASFASQLVLMIKAGLPPRMFEAALVGAPNTMFSCEAIVKGSQMSPEQLVREFSAEEGSEQLEGINQAQLAPYAEAVIKAFQFIRQREGW